MRLLVYDTLANVNGIYYVHVCEQARWARSAGNNAIENVCIIIIYYNYVWLCIVTLDQTCVLGFHRFLASVESTQSMLFWGSFEEMWYYCRLELGEM